MLNKLFNKNNTQQSPRQGGLTQKDLDPRVTLHYGIPSTASIIAFDPVQSLLAVGTLDGRIKVIGGDNIEGHLICPKPLPFKNLEFLQNQGFLASISTENEIQVWDLEHRRITSTLKWEANITAFSVINGTGYMYLGDEYGSVYVLKYNAEEGKLLHMQYYVPTNVIAEAAGISSSDHYSVVGVLPQPYSEGKRLLIAFENGLIVLWDVSEDRVVLVRGNKDLQLKGETVVDSSKAGDELSKNVSDDEHANKEISSLCWASTSGSVLAVGYVDGDIMFWDLSTAASSKDQKAESSSIDVVKLQLSSGNKRLPVIVLRWSADRSSNDCSGQLFVYGGDAIGAEEVLTILYLDWSSGIKTLKCVARVDLKLNGFADIALLTSVGAKESCGTLLFVLTNPGQLHVYDDACLSSLKAQQEKKTAASPLQYPIVIPTIEPYMTVGKLGLVFRDGKFSRDISKKFSAAKVQASHISSNSFTGSTKWPLTGGVPCQFYDAEDYLVERLYIAGYQNGSVRIWDATCPSLSLVYVLGSELADIKTPGANAPVSALEFCPLTLSLAVGNACGLVCLYTLIGSSTETSLNFVTETGKEVLDLPQEDGPQGIAVFSFLKSPVCNLQFENSGTRLAVGFECGRVAVIDISTLSLLFLTEGVSASSSPVISLALKSFSHTSSLINSPKDSDVNTSNDPVKGVMFFMTKDAHLVVCDSTTGYVLSSQSIHQKEASAISVYILEGGNLFPEISSGKQSFNSPRKSEAKNEPAQTNASHGNIPPVAELETSTETTYFGQRLTDLLVLLCCEDALFLYSLKSVIQGHCNSIKKVNLSKPCCWTTTVKKDDKECGLVVLYRTGVIEIRSLPNLEVVGEASIMSILRWNLKSNREKTLCSSDSGQIVLINEYEFAFISLFAYENDFRIPKSLPDLHDELLATASDTTIHLTPILKKAEDSAFGIFGGIVKGFKVGKAPQSLDLEEVNNACAHLDFIFSNPPFLKPSMDNIPDDQGVVELKIDDIHIDGPLVVTSSSQKSKDDGKDKKVEREKLLEGATSTTTPKLRTADEIKAKYRKTGDVSSVAAEAKNKLMERGEKLAMLSDHTLELQNGAENFADLAGELVKKMEQRKWWNI